MVLRGAGFSLRGLVLARMKLFAMFGCFLLMIASFEA
jgi:hypothetical protein